MATKLNGNLMATKLNGNLKWVISVIVSLLALAVAWGATQMQVCTVVDKEIPALKLMDKEQTETIKENEKSVVRLQGNIETLRAEQQTYYEKSFAELKAIRTAVEK